MLRTIALLALVTNSLSAYAKPARVVENGPAFIVAAPDRGFLGNEEVTDLFNTFARGRSARLVFVTDERTRDSLREAASALVQAGAREVVVLPLFLSRAELRFARLEQAIAAQSSPVPVVLGRTLGESYLAAEALGDRLRALPDRSGKRVVVVGYGAKDAASRTALTRDLAAIAGRAQQGLGLTSLEVVAWMDRAALPEGASDRDAEDALARIVTSSGNQVAVVPFHLGPKLDSMMSFDAALSGRLRTAAPLTGGDLGLDPLVGTWMAREANQHVPLRDGEVGVVVLAHGADHHWNETMRRSAAALSARYRVEFAFCMADQPVIERAIRRLEARGARGIIIVRVFGLESSFRSTVERMIGMDATDPAVHEGHGHGHGASGPPPPRIRSASVIATSGGVEDSPHFAEALVDRALGLSKDPRRETVILVAHGAGDDPTNDHWRGVLASVAQRMKAGRASAFRAIRYGTWREDWPEKRKPEVAAIRAMVEEANRDGGRAIVVPARTTAQGMERLLLSGLPFELASGFAPHPRFERWLEDQVRAGLSQLRKASYLGGEDQTPSQDVTVRR